MKAVRPVKAGWFNAFRPWTLHGAVVAVAIGGAVAFKDGQFTGWLFTLALIGGCLLQSAANLLNTYGDYTTGMDTVDNSLRTPELVTGALTPNGVLLAGIGCLLLTSLIGIVLIWEVGWGIIPFGVAGILGAALYTIGISYKYHGLGLVAVFLLMGILMPTGTYFVLTGGMSAEVFLIALPNAFLVTAVLSGNETRDYHEDRRTGAKTLSSRFSYESSMRLYLILNTLPFVMLILLILSGVLPWTVALALLTVVELRSLHRNSREAHRNQVNNQLLVPLSFRLNWHFGALLVIGYLFGHHAIPGLI